MDSADFMVSPEQSLKRQASRRLWLMGVLLCLASCFFICLGVGRGALSEPPLTENTESQQIAGCLARFLASTSQSLDHGIDLESLSFSEVLSIRARVFSSSSLSLLKQLFSDWVQEGVWTETPGQYSLKAEFSGKLRC